MARYIPYPGAQRGLENSIEVRAATRQAAKKLLDIANTLVPVGEDNGKHKGGELRRSGHVEETPESFYVVYDAPYAAYVHEGTNPHTINAKPGKMLSWVGKDGVRRYAKSVRHPGIGRTPWLTAALGMMRRGA